MTREEAIKILREAHDNALFSVRTALETLIPELKESEDEKIRRELIDFIQWSVDRHFMREDFHQAKRPSEWIAYLEKQKDSNDMEFHEGYTLGFSDGVKSVEQKETHYTKRNALFDKCVENCDPAVMKKVSDEIDEMLKKEQKPEPIFKVGDKIKLKSEPKYPYREIVDIKNGAYYFDEAVYLPFDNQDNWEKKQKPAEIDEYEIIKKHITHDSLSSEVNKRLKECGWYVTEEPVKWEEEDQKSLNRAINICISDFGEDCQTAKFLKSLPKRFNLQSMQEWSEEDEKDMAHIIRILDDCYAYGKHDLSKTDYENLVNTLKSFSPQQKVEWNEEDEEIWFTLITFFKGYLQKYPPLCKAEGTQANRILNWLNTRVKSFRLHHCYKPTEDQMKALKNISYGFYQNGDGPALRELYEQLEKLM